LATDKQTDEQMDSNDTLSRSCCREWRLNNQLLSTIIHPKDIVSQWICEVYFNDL